MDSTQSIYAGFPEGYQDYTDDGNPNFNPSQMYHGRPPYPADCSRSRQPQDESLDLSLYDDVARDSANNVPLHVVIKPEETHPWSGAQSNNLLPRDLQAAANWESHCSYARSEPPKKQDGFSDSGYGPSMPSNMNGAFYGTEELRPTRMSGNRSVRSDGRLMDAHRDGRRKQYLPACSCGRRPKNPSDQRKHTLTHTKPFRCTESDCTKKDGFATENDLQRHRFSVHGLPPSVGSSNGYICRACPLLDGRPKFWPRRDNFKAHIKRKHHDWDVDQLLDSSKQAVRPDDVIAVESAMDCAAHQSQMDHDEVINCHPMDMSPALSRLSSSQGNYSNGLWPPSSSVNISTEDELMGGMHGHTADMQYQHALMSVSSDNSLSLMSNIPSQAPFVGGSFSSFSFNKLEPDNSTHRQPQPSRMEIPNFPVFSGGSDPGTAQSAIPVANGQGDFECGVCRKRKRRECDLKKHMKRHTKPYGCTFPTCQKKFGSRNDWKRHESSRHYLREMWKCGKRCLDGTECKHRPFQRQAILERHLQGPDHMMKDMVEIKQACKDFRLGKEGNHRFWCGFCNKLVLQVKGAHNAWDERFKHIGDHFDKERLDSGEWTCIEENQKKKYILSESVKDDRRRTRTKGGDEEEADLDDYSPVVSGLLTTRAYEPSMAGIA